MELVGGYYWARPGHGGGCHSHGGSSPTSRWNVPLDVCARLCGSGVWCKAFEHSRLTKYTLCKSYSSDVDSRHPIIWLRVLHQDGDAGPTSAADAATAAAAAAAAARRALLAVAASATASSDDAPRADASAATGSRGGVPGDTLVDASAAALSTGCGKSKA